MTNRGGKTFAQCDAIVRRIVFIACMSAAPALLAQSISPGEKLLFQTNHMEGIREPVALTYSFRKEGTAEPGFDDEVHVDVTKINPDGSVGVSMNFLSGDRKLNLPQTGDANGNPALLGFLERDITEMKRLTGGSSYYFRKQIRMALADAKELRPVRFTYAGKQRAGQQVRVQPYLDDPLRNRFPKYVNKSYVFVISSEVPGGLYQIRTSSEDVAEARGKPAMMETLTLVRDRRGGQAVPKK
jgi:hypothetical protein